MSSVREVPNRYFWSDYPQKTFDPIIRFPRMLALTFIFYSLLYVTLESSEDFHEASIVKSCVG